MTGSEEHPLGAPVVRHARVDDGAAIAGILAATDWFDEDETVLHERAITLIPDAEDLARQMLIGELVGEVAGFLNVAWSHAISLPGPEGYVTELFVHPRLRGRGVGSALLDAVEEHGRMLEATRLRLPTDATVEAYARGFYRSRGMEERTITFERRLP